MRRAAPRGPGGRSAFFAFLALLTATACVEVTITREQPAQDRTAVSTGDCDDVQTFPLMSPDHIATGTPFDGYNSDPPTSGPHWPEPANPGFHPEEVPREQLVHNLEHGQLVFWYRPDAPPEFLHDLAELVNSDPVPLVAAPYSVATPSVFVVTAWGASMACSGIDGAAIDAFRARYQGRGPENVGVPTFEGV